MQASQPGKIRLTAAEFAAKFRSKSEVYAFMSIDVAAYLPPHECVTIYFLKELVEGKKKCKSSSPTPNMIPILTMPM